MTARRSPMAGLLLLPVVLVAGCRPSEQPRICAIDMGSNNFRRIVGRFADQQYTEYRIDSRTLGVGDDVQKHGGISPPKLTEILNTLSEFSAACAADGAPSPVAVGTAAFRDAKNAVEAVAAATLAGVRMEIASERRESELAYLVGSLGRDGVAVIDNGSRSIELVSKPDGKLQHHVFTLGYRIAFEQFLENHSDPAAAVGALRARLLQEAGSAPFMKGQTRLVGVEFMEMAEVLFEPVNDGHTFTLAQLKAKLDSIVAAGAADFARLKATEDIDRALPRLVTAVTLMEAYGYSEMQLTSRQLGTGLIIEAGLRR